MEKKKERRSNYELMRNISMLLIVTWHVISHTHLLTESTGLLGILVKFLVCITYVHVTSFVIATGYFQSQSKFKLSKVLSLIGAVWFYRVVISLVFQFTGLIELTKLDFYHLLYPLWDFDEYWFINIYIILYLMSPILNKVIHNVNKKQFQKVIAILFVLFSVVPTLTNQQVINDTQGFSITFFILIYFIGAYFRKYPISECFLMKGFTPKMQQAIYFVSFFALAFLNLLLWNFSTILTQFGSIPNEIGTLLTKQVGSYDNPILIFQSLAYFFFFGTLTLKNKQINRISPLVFGVYLIHENMYIRSILYDKLGITQFFLKSGYEVLLWVILLGLGILIVCLIIEKLRKTMFDFIGNLKWTTKLRDKFKNWVRALGLQISW